MTAFVEEEELTAEQFFDLKSKEIEEFCKDRDDIAVFLVAAGKADNPTEEGDSFSIKQINITSHLETLYVHVTNLYAKFNALFSSTKQ